MPVPSLISSGAQAATAASVLNPSTLTPTLPGSRQNGDVLFCLTTCRSATPTVSVSGWTQHFSVTGTFGRIALFSRVVDGTEAAPSVVWTGLTTGNSGTPALAIVSCFRNLKVVSGAPVIQIQGGVGNQAASSTLATWGSGFGGSAKNQSLRFALVVRQDDAGTWTPQFIGGVAWTANNHATTTSGSDMTQHWDYFVMTTGGSIGGGSYDIAGGASAGSSGINIAIEALPITQAVGTASETDTAQPIQPAKRVSVGTAVETDTALPITRGVPPHPVGTATETDSALPITAAKARSIGIALEADSAQPIPAAKRAAIGAASETDSALPISPAKAIALGIAPETDTALPITRGEPSIVVPVGTAVEVDTALPITRLVEQPPTPPEPVQPHVPIGTPPRRGPVRERKTTVDVVRLRTEIATRVRGTATDAVVRVETVEGTTRWHPGDSPQLRSYAPSLVRLRAQAGVSKRGQPMSERALREEREELLLVVD